MMEFHGDNPVQHNVHTVNDQDSLFHEYLKLARAGEVGPDGKPIFVDPPYKPMPEAELAKQLAHQLKDANDPSQILPLTQKLLAPMTNSDEIENSLDWLQDKLDKRLDGSPWAAHFKYYPENDRLEVTTTNKIDPSKSSTVSEPRQHL